MGNPKILMVTGGQRSGKSEYAERRALAQSETPVYIATARIFDDEFRERVEAHKRRRGPQWTNIEEPEHISQHPQPRQTVLMDCLTLLATNLFFAEDEDVNKSFSRFKAEFDRFCSSSPDAHLIFVTNEIGLGGVSENAMRRRFTDLLGLVNRYVADHADEVVMCVSGIPLIIK